MISIRRTVKMNQITRINLKTDCEDRSNLIDFCLNHEKQYLVIGWSSIYKKDIEINTYKDFYYAVKEDVSKKGSRLNHAFNVFRDAKVDDLFWTRDLDGNYWICRVREKARPKYDRAMDIGAVLPVVAFKVGMQVPGQIKAAFNRPRGGIAGSIREDIIVEYSKHMYNTLSGINKYKCNQLSGSILDNLPDFNLEELVIAYLQIEKNFYVLTNSIAKRSTTIKIECELIGRDKNNKKKAVVQVKGGKTKSIDAMSYKSYSDDGYEVYLYAPVIENLRSVPNCIEITREDLTTFYNEYKCILPESITRLENLFS
jgi:hypothetical protein